MAAGGKDPKTPITEPPLDEELNDEIQANLSTINPSSRRDQQELKLQCLRRDGYCCVVSGRVAGGFQHKVPSATEGSLSHCAHILPFALRKFDPQYAQEVSVNYILVYKYLFKC